MDPKVMAPKLAASAAELRLQLDRGRPDMGLASEFAEGVENYGGYSRKPGAFLGEWPAVFRAVGLRLPRLTDADRACAERLMAATDRKDDGLVPNALLPFAHRGDLEQLLGLFVPLEPPAPRRSRWSGGRRRAGDPRQLQFEFMASAPGG